MIKKLDEYGDDLIEFWEDDEVVDTVLDMPESVRSRCHGILGPPSDFLETVTIFTEGYYIVIFKPSKAAGGGIALFASKTKELLVKHIKKMILTEDANLIKIANTIIENLNKIK